MASFKIEQRPIGSQGLVVSAEGLGCMGMTAFYKPQEDFNDSVAMAVFDKCQEIGLTFLDTAFIYQSETAHNEELVGKAIAKYGRDKWIIATKFGIDFASAKQFDSSPATIRRQLEASLKRLGTDYVDLYYQHRVDPDTPIEVVAQTFKELHAEGKIRYCGYSEITADELRRAHAVFPVTAIQMEWSLHTRGIEKEIVPTARELGIGIVAYSPLGRGLLTSSFTKREDIPAGDWRLMVPRFSEENFAKNQAATQRLAEIAARKGITVAQLALAWLHNQGKDVFPIPGTKSAQRLLDNAKASAVVLTREEMDEIEANVPEPEGDRYPAGFNPTLWEGRSNL